MNIEWTSVKLITYMMYVYEQFSVCFRNKFCTREKD